MRYFFAALIVSLTALAMPLHAQGYPFSQRGSVTQRIAFTEIKIEYGRPSAKGRALFGALVPWDSVWHPGADLATQLSISHDITLEGQTLPKGVYTVWLIPRAQGAWTFILNKTTHIQHTPYPGASSDALRVDVVPDENSRVETLTYLFPLVVRDDATLRIEWGTTGITVRVKADYRPASMR